MPREAEVKDKRRKSMVRLEEINGKNVWEVLKLKVSEEQKAFVAPNDISIIEAYTATQANGFAFPFGISR